MFEYNFENEMKEWISLGKPKTFLEWFSDNQKIGDIDLLKTLQENNKNFQKND